MQVTEYAFIFRDSRKADAIDRITTQVGVVDMFCVSSRIQTNKGVVKYGVIDTSDGVEEVYTVDYLRNLKDIDIKGFSKQTGTAEGYSFYESYIISQIRKFQIACAFPIVAVPRVYDNSYRTQKNGLDITKYDTSLEVLDAEDNNLKYLKIPYGVGSLQFRDSRSLSNVEEVVLPSSLRFIYGFAFERWSCLRKINIPDRLYSVGFNCFKRTALEYIDWSSTNLENIGDGCFSECSKLRKVILPKKLSYIDTDVDSGWGNGCFAGCTQLEEVVFNSPISRLGDIVFSWCEKLKTVYLPYNLRDVSEDTFFGCKNLRDLYFRGDSDLARRTANKVLKDLDTLGISVNQVRVHIN